MLDILPEYLNSIKGLELIAKKILEGNRLGKSPSNRNGFGQTFSQYRNYEPGDDLRLLDWKVLAKTDRYYVKESEISSNISIQFLVDGSSSMDYQEAVWSKLDYARLLCAVLGKLGQNQGDQINLNVFQKEYRPLPKKQNWPFFLHHLSTLKTQASNPLDFKIPLPSKKEKSISLIFTDLYQLKKEWLELLESNSGPRKEILLFHITGPKERAMDFKGNFTFQDLETKEEVNINARNIQQKYQKNWNEWEKQWRDTCLSLGIQYIATDLGEHPSKSLSLFLKRRQKLTT